MSRHPGLLTAVVVAVILLGGGALALCRSPVGAAVFASRGHFIPSDANPAVLYEPGMEREAKLVAAALPQAIATVEAGQYLPVAKPFNVYVCASQESFNRYMGAPAGATARGVKVLNDIFLSPATFSSWRGDTHASVLAHELSHLHLYQRLGHRRSLWDMPVWFVEGLAVAVSGGGGEGVSVGEAVNALTSGDHFVPDVRGSFLRPKRAADYGVETYMFYRQSELFVRFIMERDPPAFESFMQSLQLNGGRFATLFDSSFGLSVAEMWSEFRRSLAAPGA
jgi:hypothetical protein